MDLYKRAIGKGKTKTFCCDNKMSAQMVIANNNLGGKCKASNSGQCNIGYGTGQNYKFRCFNMNDEVDPDKLDKEHPDAKTEADYKDTYRRFIVEGKQQYSKTGETCSYVPGTLARAVKPVMGVTKLGANLIYKPFAFTGKAYSRYNKEVDPEKGGRGRDRTQKKRKQSRKRKSGKRSSRKKPST